MDVREMTSAERAVLAELLSRDFTGAAELRAQLDAALVEPGCGCGCGSIAFVFPDGAGVPRSATPNPVPVAVAILDEVGCEVGGLVVFVSEGLLSYVDVYSYFDAILWPELSRIRWDT